MTTENKTENQPQVTKAVNEYIPFKQYILQIVDVALKTSKKQNKMLVLGVEIRSPEKVDWKSGPITTAGVRFSHFVVFNDNKLEMANEFCKKLGVPCFLEVPKEEDIKMLVERFSGISFKAKVQSKESYDQEENWDAAEDKPVMTFVLDEAGNKILKWQYGIQFIYGRVELNQPF